MDCTATDYHPLDEKLHDPTESPIPLPFEFLQNITGNFSNERELGRGGYGIVYKGIFGSGKIIAVKRLFDHLVDGDQFQKEVTNLLGIKHKNIVQLVGYCAETKSEAIKIPSGIHVMAQIPRSLLCFEYLGNKSLDKHVSDESSCLDWNKRYEIIKGICSGLHYLHGECHIVHLDLKPENILMDDTMMPKIADFGLSRLLGAHQSRTIVSGNLAGSLGYMAPEYQFQGVVSPKADIFSFGVIIIEIITGVKEYPMSMVPYFQQFNENPSCQSTGISLKKYKERVVGRWSNMFKREPNHTLPERRTEQVEQCITIGLECLDFDSTRRPSACDISQMLTGEKCSCQKKTLLSTQPFKLGFQFTKYHHVTSCPLRLTNSTDDAVAFQIMPNHRDKYFLGPLYGLVLPRSTYTLRVAMYPPPEEDNRFTIELQCAIVGAQNQLPDVQVSGSADEYNRFFTKAREQGREVQQKKLLFDILREQGNMEKMIPNDFPSPVRRMLVHPTKTWIISACVWGEHIHIWDYQTQETICSSELFSVLGVLMGAVFIPQKQWYVVGDDGDIKVFSYETMREIKTFCAHRSPITSLEIHPREPFLLSTSIGDRSIRLWNWEKGWECVKTFETQATHEVKFNPKDADYFACADEKHIEIWNIASPASGPLKFSTKTSGLMIHLEYLTCGDELYLISGHDNGLVKIWDWQSGTCLKTLEGHTHFVSAICTHPDHPLLITGSWDNTVCLWNSSTFELVGKLKGDFGYSVNAISFLNGSKRIAIGHDNGIAIAEI